MTSPAIFLTDLAGVVVAWHPSAERLFGLAWEEVAGDFLGSFWSLDGLEPDAMPLRFSRRRRFDFDGWLARRRGDPFWASGFTTPLLDDAGVAVAFAVVTVDDTERRHVRLLVRHLGGLEGPGTEGLRPFGLTGPMLDWASAALGMRVREARGVALYNSLSSSGDRLDCFAFPPSSTYPCPTEPVRQRGVPLRSRTAQPLRGRGADEPHTSRRGQLHAGPFPPGDPGGRRVRVQLAPDGEAGLEVLAAEDFDLVITDVVMPGISGYELCRRIKADPARRHVPVVLLTALRDPSEMVQGIECGADNFIAKPYRAEDLLARVRGLFANRALRLQGGADGAVEAVFLGRRLTVTSGKEQILDLLLSTCEEVARNNRDLERRVQLRTAELSEATARSGRLADLVDSSEDGIVATDLDGVITDWNAGAEHLFGYPAAEADRAGASSCWCPPRPGARGRARWGGSGGARRSSPTRRRGGGRTASPSPCRCGPPRCGTGAASWAAP